MELANPVYLWGLLGLLIPLAIHLLSRKAGRVVRVGSIRHFAESSTRRFKSIRFNEYLLFVLRTLAVILFVLLLADLTMPGQEARLKWVLVEGDAEAFPAVSARLDSLEDAGYELRAFAAGFPPPAEGGEQPAPENYPYLLRQLKQANVEAVVMAGNRLQAFRGRSMALPANVRWLQLPMDRNKDTTISAMRLSPDTVALVRGQTGADRTSFTHARQYAPKADSAPETLLAAEARTPRILLVIGEDNPQAELLRAALKAVSVAGDYPLQWEQVAVRPRADSLRRYDVLIDLSGGNFSTVDSLVQIIRRRTSAGQLLEQIGPNAWRLDATFNRQRILRGDLLIRLARILLRNEQLERDLQDWDQRSIDESIFFTDRSLPATAVSEQRASLDQWLILLLIVTLVIERIIAFYRKA